MNTFFERAAAAFMASTMLFTSVSANNGGSFFNTIATDGSGSTVTDTGYYQPAKFSNFEENNERDTKGTGDDKEYNTSLGLHTDKTVEKVYPDDGRTFDLGLETWYVGENPVDVGMVLDASGSMAWTTNTIYPLNVSDYYEDLGISGLDKLKEEQERNGGYLTESTVEKILKPENTDNSKLGYNNYMYYVYEARSSVSEFVPLGYWDGGKTALDDSLIGYYSFDNTLSNELGGKAKLIANVSDKETFSDTQLMENPVVAYDSTKGIDIKKTAPYGGIMLDKVPKTNKFSISMDITGGDTAGDNTTPILCITDGTNYYNIIRANGSSTSRLKIGVDGNDGNVLNANAAFPTGSNTWKFTFDFDKNTLTVNVTQKVNLDSKADTGDSNGKENEYTTEKNIIKLDLDKLQIIVGGSKSQITTCPEVFVKNLIINEFTSDEVSNKIAEYKLTSDLTEDVGKGSATFVKQAYENGGTFNVEATPGPIEAKPEYDNNALDITTTNKEGGAVKLDVKPSNIDNFTISFKIKRNGSLNDKHQNLFYIGSLNPSNGYYQFYRSYSGRGFLVMAENTQSDSGTSDKNNMYYKGGVADNDWYTQTLVFTVSDSDPSKIKIIPYINGKEATDLNDPQDVNIPDMDKISAADLNLIVGALSNNYDTTKHLIDDLYVFDRALTPKEVEDIYNETEKGASGNYAECEDDGSVHAKTKDGDKQIAQIKEELAKNVSVNRRGWYYVNSHSDWCDIAGCLSSGKQYVGIVKENATGEGYYSHKDVAAVPPAYDSSSENYTEIVNENNNHDDYIPPEIERSIRFYVDNSNHLRCFVCAGGDSKEGEPHTFCSVVYVNDGTNRGGEKSEIKYETLNNAINGFVEQLYNISGQSNVSAVRFSTHNILKGLEKDTTEGEKELKKLITLNWTHDQGKARNIILPRYEDNNDEYNSKGNSGATTNPEYNYVMTGGTYTWTGLKAFYDNLCGSTEVAENGRPKYLIIFTDGRDNLEGESEKKDYTEYKPSSSSVLNENDLAEAWAEALRDEGYTIYCVMMATGSVSSSTNELEYNKAKGFLTRLAGDSSRVFISDPNSEETLDKQFDHILEDIGKKLTSYTVKDYIDPRFDLVDYTDKTKTEGEVWHLSKGDDGKGKVVKVTNVEGGTEATSEVKTVEVNGSEAWVYTPKESHTGSDEKEAYLFYDSEKDMFYLEWRDQDINGATTPIDSTDGTGKKLDVWKSVITVKAKDDFIGGNTILTNGNEANMNYVFCPEDKDSDGNLRASSGIDRARDVYEEGDAVINKETGETTGDTVKVGDPLIGAKRFDYVSKGFPRTTVNVELLKLEANGLGDNVYLGEASSPADMLYKLENGVTPSYYLEYLRRYANHLVNIGSLKPEDIVDSGITIADDPDINNLLALLNKWLGFDFTSGASTASTDNKVNKFSIPYVYLPDTKTKNNVGDVAVKENNRNNTKDVVGILTYEWHREVSPGYIKNNTSSFIIETTKGMQYSLTVKYEPLPENKDGVQMNFDAKVGVSSEQDKYNYYFVPDSDFNGGTTVTLRSTTSSEPQERYTALNHKTRSEYIENNLVTDGVYKWNGGEDEGKSGAPAAPPKPTVGETQVDTDAGDKGYYGDSNTTYANSYDGNFLSADSKYTRDVVSGGLALELRVRGSDLKNIINDSENNQKYTITAVRSYSDSGSGAIYDHGDGGIDPNVKDEKYNLTFTYSTVPAFGRMLQPADAGEVDENRVYSVIYKLTEYAAEKGEEGTHTPYWTDGVDTDGDSTSANNTFDLPIGKYTITYDSPQTLVGTDYTGGKKELKYISVERDVSTYKPEYFDDNVILGLYDDDEVIKPGDPKIDDEGDIESGAPKIDDEDVIESGEHEINNENIGDYIADSALTEAEGVSTAEFYLGTDKYGNKGEDKAYLNDRLGMIVLYAEQPSLSVSKTVRYGTPYVTNDTKWHFEAEIVYEFENEPSSDQISKCEKVCDISEATFYYTENPEGTTVSTGFGDESIWTGFVKDAGSSIGNKLVYKTDMYLKHRQRLEINDIPTVTGASVKYNVTEILDVAGLDEDAKEALEVHRVLDDGHEKIIKHMGTMTNPSIPDEELVFGSSEDIVNEFPAYALPGTGGRGVYGIMLAGGFMMIISLGLLYLRKRREYRA